MPYFIGGNVHQDCQYGEKNKGTLPKTTKSKTTI